TALLLITIMLLSTFAGCNFNKDNVGSVSGVDVSSETASTENVESEIVKKPVVSSNNNNNNNNNSSSVQSKLPNPTVSTSSQGGNAEDLLNKKPETSTTVKKEKIVVPEIEGKVFARLEQSLKDLGLVLDVSEVASETIKGRVISQSIKAGTEVDFGTEIIIVVSSGPAASYATVPDVTGKSRLNAKDILSKAGFMVEEELKCSDTVNEGFVVTQNVAPGYSIEKYSTIKIYISVGPANTKGCESYNDCSSLVVKQGNWIYFADPHYNNNIYKMRIGSNEKILIYRNEVEQINVVGDWIYFIENDKETQGKMNISKISLSGNEYTKIDQADFISWFHVIDGYIYYTDITDDSKDFFYRIKTDGSQKTILSTELCHAINFIGDYIYYEFPGDYGNVHRMKRDGSEKSIAIYDFPFTELESYKQQIFFSIDKSTNKLYFTDLEGLIRYNISFGDLEISKLQATDDYLYMFIKDPSLPKGKQVAYYRLSYDFEVFEKVFEANNDSLMSGASPHIIDDWIYFYSRSYYLYRVKTDGSSIQSLVGTGFTDGFKTK
ncbi:MAG: DUF5050 domain-containing protein, partial [Oscillospiraceae bacterium]|nr:DUF5050 domain-containing protein [Oscillospiraceae bacterium]